MSFLHRSARLLPHFGNSQSSKVKVVIESVDQAERFIAQQLLEDAGYEVVSCGGPDGLPGTQCPVVDGNTCPAIEQADVVVTSFRVENPAGASIIAAVRMRYPDTPLIVEAPPFVAERHAHVLAGTQVIYPMTAERLKAAVRRVAL